MRLIGRNGRETHIRRVTARSADGGTYNMFEVGYTRRIDGVPHTTSFAVGGRHDVRPATKQPPCSEVKPEPKVNPEPETKPEPRPQPKPAHKTKVESKLINVQRWDADSLSPKQNWDHHELSREEIDQTCGVFLSSKETTLVLKKQCRELRKWYFGYNRFYKKWIAITKSMISEPNIWNDGRLWRDVEVIDRVFTFDDQANCRAYAQWLVNHGWIEIKDYLMYSH